MKLFAFYTDEQRALKNIFLETIRDDWDLNISYWGKAGGKGGNTGTPEFARLMRKKVEYIAGLIKSNWGDTILWSDIDIQFFGKCSDLIARMTLDKDIVFQSEHWPKNDLNVGFMAIRCNEKSLLLFETVLKTPFENLPCLDQTAINDILQKDTFKIKWGVLPGQFWAPSHEEPPTTDIVLHHANCTRPIMRNNKMITSTELKLMRLRKIRLYVFLLRLFPWLVFIALRLKKLISLLKPTNIKKSL